jgi:Tol biopolymer transport system component
MKKVGAIAGLVGLVLSNASGQVLQITPLLDDLEGQILSASLSPDGKTLAFQWCSQNVERCGIYTRPLAGGPMKLLVGGANRGADLGMPQWSPDGKMIVYTDFRNRWDIRLVVRNLATGVERELGGFCNARGGGSPPSWSPDSQWVAASRNMEDMACAPTVFPVDGDQPIRNLAQSGSSPVFSPDGRLLAYAEGKPLKLVPLGPDYRSTAPAATLVQEPRPIVGITWTHDGKGILYEALGDSPSGSSQIYVRRTVPRPGALPAPVPGLPSGLLISSILESTGGGALALVTQPVEPSWERMDLKGMPPKIVETPPKIEAAPEPTCSAGGSADSFVPNDPPWPPVTCSPDRSLRAFISTRMGLAEIHVANADGLLVNSVGPGKNGWSVDEVPHIAGWSPDGKWIAIVVHPLFGDHGSDYANLYIVPAFGGPARRVAQKIERFAWSPDSQFVIVSPDLAYSPGPLFRVDLPDGKVTQLAVHGSSPKISPDGKWLYFLRDSWQKSELFRVPVNGGRGEPIGAAPRANFLVGKTYLYLFRERQILPGAVVEEIVLVDPQTHLTSAPVEAPLFSSAWLSPNERFLYFELNQGENAKPRLVLIPGL